MNITLRFATPEDAAAVNEIYDYYIENTVFTFNEVNKSVEERAEDIAKLTQIYPFLIAEADGRFLGFANAEPVRSQTGYRYSVELTIYLHPDAPKHVGIGRLLYHRLFEILKAQGFRTAYAVISGTNFESVDFHKSFGFEPIASFRSSGYKHGIWLDSLWMQKQLNPYDASPDMPVPFSEYRTRV